MIEERGRYSSERYEYDDPSGRFSELISGDFPTETGEIEESSGKEEHPAKIDNWIEAEYKIQESSPTR